MTLSALNVLPARLPFVSLVVLSGTPVRSVPLLLTQSYVDLTTSRLLLELTCAEWQVDGFAYGNN